MKKYVTNTQKSNKWSFGETACITVVDCNVCMSFICIYTRYYDNNDDDYDYYY